MVGTRCARVLVLVEEFAAVSTQAVFVRRCVGVGLPMRHLDSQSNWLAAGVSPANLRFRPRHAWSRHRGVAVLATVGLLVIVTAALLLVSARPGTDKVHLFLAGPGGFALLLGHRWNRVRPTFVYEHLGTGRGYTPAYEIPA